MSPLVKQWAHRDANLLQLSSQTCGAVVLIPGISAQLWLLLLAGLLLQGSGLSQQGL